MTLHAQASAAAGQWQQSIRTLELAQQLQFYQASFHHTGGDSGNSDFFGKAYDSLDSGPKSTSEAHFKAFHALSELASLLTGKPNARELHVRFGREVERTALLLSSLGTSERNTRIRPPAVPRQQRFERALGATRLASAAKVLARDDQLGVVVLPIIEPGSAGLLVQRRFAQALQVLVISIAAAPAVAME